MLNIKNITLKKNLIIWGTGSYGFFFLQKYEILRPYLLYAVDKDINKICNNTIHDLTIKKASFENLKNRIILVTSSFENEISKELNELGFVEGTDFYLGSKIHKVGTKFYYPEMEFLHLTNSEMANINQINQEIIFNKQELIISTANVIGEKLEILHGEKVNFYNKKLGIYSVNKGLVVAEHGAVYDSSFHLILDSILYSKYHFHKFEKLLNNKIHKPIDINGTVGVITSIFGGMNYYHWILNELPRLLLLLKSNVVPDYYISMYQGRKFQREILDLLGIEIEKIIPVEKNMALRATKVIFPTFINDEIISPYGLFDIPKWVTKVVREFILEKVEHEDFDIPFVYISRRKAPTRRVINEKEVLEKLKPYGFKSVVLEDLSFKQQVNLFRNAKVIIALHGAGLTNLIFANKGVKVYEIFHPKWVKNCFNVLCNAVKGEYYYSVGVGDTVNNSSNSKDSNVYINLDYLNEFLNLI